MKPISLPPAAEEHSKPLLTEHKHPALAQSNELPLYTTTSPLPTPSSAPSTSSTPTQSKRRPRPAWLTPFLRLSNTIALLSILYGLYGLARYFGFRLERVFGPDVKGFAGVGEGGGEGNEGQKVGQGGRYMLGVGMADITGPVVEINMMGYADQTQLGTGLHMRLRSRAFLVASEDLNDRWVLVNADICMGDTAIRLGVLEQLEELYPGVYGPGRVAIVGTHSHAGVGGYMQNVLPQITSRGFVRQSYSSIVSGILLSIQRAHTSLAPGTLELGVKELLETNINRSPFAYEQNPAEERARYEWDLDKEFVLLRFGDERGKERGFASFFPVHGTSLYRNNTLISGDNKGMAAFLYEQQAEPGRLPGEGGFVAGFFQASVGDTSPNTLGAFCESGPDAGKPCSYENSTCNGRAQGCQGRGPGWEVSDFESDRIIGENQYRAAKSIMSSSSRTQVSGNVRAVHLTVDMGNYTFKLENGTQVRTCPPALGYGFAGGTSDGAGKFDFTQNRNGTERNPFWQYVKSGIGGTPTPEQAECHWPKPILFNTGYAHNPYDWSPSIVDMQIFRVGQIVILIVPAEFTTMAGRRLMEAVKNELTVQGIVDQDARVILTGPANTYTHYVATPEEYRVQRYEGASTLFGPWTLDAYKDIFTSLASYVADSALSGPDPGPPLPDLRSQQKSFHLPVVTDRAPIGKPFGAVLEDVEQNRTFYTGESVSATFQGANPRNNLRLEDTYLRVERAEGEDWRTVRTDSHPSTTFQWERTSTLLGTSIVNITWTIEPHTPAGTYRLHYYGDSKSLLGKMTPFEGVSSAFDVGGAV